VRIAGERHSAFSLRIEARILEIILLIAVVWFANRNRAPSVAAVADRGRAVIDFLPDNDAYTPTAVNDRGYIRLIFSRVPRHVSNIALVRIGSRAR
jgi:hypothetical protein